YRTDGTEEGTHVVDSGTVGGDLFALGDSVLYQKQLSTDTERGVGLFIARPTGKQLLTRLSGTGLIGVGKRAVFGKWFHTHDELWSTDGTVRGTGPLLSPIYASYTRLFPCLGRLVMFDEDVPTSAAWVTDGTRRAPSLHSFRRGPRSRRSAWRTPEDRASSSWPVPRRREVSGRRT